MRILVTGGAGYVGSFATRFLLAAGHEVAVVDNLLGGHRAAIPEEILYEGEISDAALIARVVEERGIETAMHFATFAEARVSVVEPRDYYRNNVSQTAAFLEALVDNGVGSLLFSSTGSVYGDDVIVPITESTPHAPPNPYAFTHHCIERMIEDFAGAYGLRYAVLRYFNAAGAALDGSHGEDHDPETHLIPLVVQTLLGKHERVEVFGQDYNTPDGTCVRDYVHVEDLADVHELALQWCSALEPGHGGAFNVGSGRGTSVLEVLRAAEVLTGQEVPFTYTGRREGDPPQLIASCTKANQVLGWRAEHDRIEDIISSAWKWHSTHPDGYGG